MNESAAFILGEFLIQQGIFGDSASLLWPLYKHSFPDVEGVPDSAAAIYDTSGFKDGRLMATGETIEHDGIMVRVRALNPADAANKARAVAAFLEQVAGTGVTVNGHAYTLDNISQVGTPTFIGKEIEGRRRSHFTVNFRTTITPGSSDAPPPINPDQQLVLANGVAKTLIAIDLPLGSMKGGKLSYVIKSTDGASAQVDSGVLSWVAQHTNNGTAVSVNVNADAPAAIADSGTGIDVTGAYDSSVPNQVLIQIVVTTTGFEPTSMTIAYEASGDSQ